MSKSFIALLLAAALCLTACAGSEKKTDTAVTAATSAAAETAAAATTAAAEEKPDSSETADPEAEEKGVYKLNGYSFKADESKWEYHNKGGEDGIDCYLLYKANAGEQGKPESAPIMISIGTLGTGAESVTLDSMVKDYTDIYTEYGMEILEKKELGLGGKDAVTLVLRNGNSDPVTIVEHTICVNDGAVVSFTLRSEEKLLTEIRSDTDTVMKSFKFQK